MKWLVLSLMCLCLCGCDAKDTTGFSLDLDNLNWQTGALIALAYFANSRGHLASVAKVVLSVLRGLKILPSADSKESLTANDTAKLLAELYLKLSGQPELQGQLLKLMVPQPQVASDEKLEARG